MLGKMLSKIIGSQRNSVSWALSEICSEPPEDLIDYFINQNHPKSDELGINPINVTAAVNYGMGLRDNAIIGPLFDLVPLEDGNNSNPFCYITRGPAKGCILHLMHDDRAKISHRSLKSYIAATAAAVEAKIPVYELPYDNQIFRPNVDEYIQGLEDTDLGREEACLLVTLLDIGNFEVIERYSFHEDVYVREAVAIHLIDHPEKVFEDMALRLSKDEEFEVSYSAKIALRGIQVK